MTTQATPPASMKFFQGFPASPGVAIGPVFLIESDHRPPASSFLSEHEIDDEIERFNSAVEHAKAHLNLLKETASQTLNDQSPVQIFEAHLLLLEDPILIERTRELIRKDRLNAHKVFYETYQDAAEKLGAVDNPLIRERVSDLEEVCQLVISFLRQDHLAKEQKFPPGAIVVAHDLGPGQTVSMSHQQIKGFAINVGGPTSHTAIMAQALKIPAVVATSNITQFAKTGDMIIVDGEEGLIILHPKPAKIAEYRLKEQYLADMQSELASLKELPAVTRDGRSIELAANIELPDEVHNVINYGAEAIGLFRTEYLFVNVEHPPTEEEQFEVYRKVAQTMNPKPVVFRTVDVGGDKFASSMPIESELNPFLGLRAIRLYRQYPDIFREQLRALLRASVFGGVKIMFPMVCLIEEVAFGIEAIRQEMAALEFNGHEFDPNVEVGIMIETPAAAMISDLLARKVNFFSIGTNDLIQYTLAVDRNNQSVTHLYEPFHPSVLRLIKNVVDNAHRNQIWVGLCGEMAADPYAAVILMGLGIDELSMGPINIPTVKKMIRNVNMSDIRDLAHEVLECSSASEVKERIMSALHRLYVPEYLV